MESFQLKEVLVLVINHREVTQWSAFQLDLSWDHGCTKWAFFFFWLTFDFFILGFGGVYKGLTATVIKQGTNQMIRFFVYSNLKNYLQGGDPSVDIGSIKTFCIGGVAGAASVFGNTPVDVVKTRMQVCEHWYFLKMFAWTFTSWYSFFFFNFCCI